MNGLLNGNQRDPVVDDNIQNATYSVNLKRRQNEWMLLYLNNEWDEISRYA